MVFTKVIRFIPRSVSNISRIHTAIVLTQTEHQSSSSSENSSDDDEYEDNIKKKILRASLPFVVKHGWTKEAIGLGAESIGYSSASRSIFNNSGIELVYYFQQVCNDDLNEYLTVRRTQEKVGSDKFAEVSTVLETRLRMLVPVLTRWPQAMALQADSKNPLMSLRLLYDLADDICYHVGGNDVNMEWYSNRIAVAGLYLSGELSLIQDKSPDFSETWSFLNRRVQELKGIQSYTDKLSTEQLSVFSNAVFTTLKNIVGIRTR